MLTVCNRTDTAAPHRALLHHGWRALAGAARPRPNTARRFTRAREGRDGEWAPADKDCEARLYAIVDSVGKRGTPGEQLQNGISVAMRSEGWDAKNVTHIMGLRAFTSQLLCKEVIGRGLRRVGYDTEEVAGADGEPRRLFRPEFVNVFGVSLSIFEHVGEEGDAPPPPKLSTQIDVLPERHAFEIRWPNGHHLREENVEWIEPILDEEQPLGSTRQMRTWYTTKPCQSTARSQISHVVADSAWEAHAANILEQHPLVQAYAKNAHLGFQVHYLWNGSRRRFVPDFLVRLVNGRTLVVEIKGEDSDQDKAKRRALDTWVQAVNSKGGFGVWSADVVFEMASLHDLIDRHAR